MHTEQILQTHPRGDVDTTHLTEVIESLLDCAQACTSCADACLAEDMVADLRRCIRLNQDCADVCLAGARIASRLTDSDSETLRSLLNACEVACRACADECDQHAQMHEHCRICAEACRRCAEVCSQALQQLS
ncbi:MAG: four-helix bundle copper-binding protein [Actinobacteria bacterium]|jgi:hypothetical protein|nr:four-helix bundle copper-binding protein [Actinomycetota bacterium]